MHSVISPETHLESFLIDLGNSKWVWSYWQRFAILLAHSLWPLSWWPFWKELPFTSHTFVFQSTTGHMVQQMSSALYLEVWSRVSSLLHEFTYLLYLRKTKYLSIFWLGEHGRDFQGEHNHKQVLQEIGSHLHSHLISDISLTEMLLFWHTVHYFRYSTFFFILCSFTKLPAF